MSKDPGRLARSLIDRWFEVRDGVLHIEGHGVEALATRFGTPLYIFSARVLRERLTEVCAALGPELNVLYALKANPNAAVARVFEQAGAGAEVASAGEILVARRAGFSGDRVQFAGPGKHGDDLRLGLADGLTFNAESTDELRALSAAAVSASRPAFVALRLNPPESKSGARMSMGGGSAKFGIDLEDLPAVAQLAESLPQVELRGLHMYAGTQTFDPDGWLSQAEVLLKAAHSLESTLGRSLASLNFGGGFGVPVSDSDKPFDLDRVGKGLQALLSKETASRTYFVELGRYLVAEAGLFVAQVLYKKESRGISHAILDGGMNHHAAAAGLGSVIRRSYPVVKVSDVNADFEPGCRMGGPLCTPADAFPPTDGMPPLEAGDLVAFLGSGAYGLTFSNVMFLGHPTPAEVMVDGSSAYLVRERGTLEDVLRGQRLCPDHG